MRVAALYDVHGNLPALEAVLADPRLGGADVIVSGGDLVMGTYPAECLDRLEADRRARLPLGEQWLAPVLRGEVTAEEATDEFERRRCGA